MKKNVASINLQSIACVLLCLVMLLGLFMPFFSFAGVEKLLRDTAKYTYSYETEMILEIIADVLEDGNYLQTLLLAFADYDWDYSKPDKKDQDDLEAYYDGIMARLENEMERKVDGVESLIEDYGDEIADILYYGDFDDVDDAVNMVVELLNKPKIVDTLGMVMVYYVAEFYCWDMGDESMWEAVDLTDYITTLQRFAKATADQRISPIEMGRTIKMCSMFADMVVAYADGYVDDEFFEEMKEYRDTGYLSLWEELEIFLYEYASVLRAAKIASTVLAVVYAIMVLAIAALALFGKKKRGFVLSVAVTAVNALVLIGLLIACVKLNHSMSDMLGDSLYTSVSVRLYSVTVWAVIMPFIGAALALLTKRLGAGKPLASAGRVDYGGGYMQALHAPAGWTCVCGNACNDTQRFCTSCGRSRLEQPMLRRRCVCGYELDEDTVFCPACGRRQ